MCIVLYSATHGQNSNKRIRISYSLINSEIKVISLYLLSLVTDTSGLVCFHTKCKINTSAICSKDIYIFGTNDQN